MYALWRKDGLDPLASSKYGHHLHQAYSQVFTVNILEHIANNKVKKSEKNKKSHWKRTRREPR